MAIARMIQIMQLMDEEGSVSLTRVSLLSEYLEGCLVFALGDIDVDDLGVDCKMVRRPGCWRHLRM